MNCYPKSKWQEHLPLGDDGGFLRRCTRWIHMAFGERCEMLAELFNEPGI